MSPTTEQLIWIGSYTPDSGGTGAGIGAAIAGETGLVLTGTAVDAASPSFLATHPFLPIVYAVGEHAQTVRAYRRSGPAGLLPFGEAWPAGVNACHVAADPSGRFITVACWGDGGVLLYSLDDEGGITARLDAEPATDPYADKPDRADMATGGDRASRAHASLVLDDGRVMTTDLGFDVVRLWNYSASEGLVPDHDVALPYASGPRHLVQHPFGTVFVVTEYSVEIAVLVRGPDGRFTFEHVVPASTEVTGGDTAAEIALSPDNRFVYVGIRGSNQIAVLAVGGCGTTLQPVATVPCGGEWPRHHLIHGSWLHVANERSGNIASFALDPVTGIPGKAHSNVKVGSPAALIPATWLPPRPTGK